MKFELLLELAGLILFCSYKTLSQEIPFEKQVFFEKIWAVLFMKVCRDNIILGYDTDYDNIEDYHLIYKIVEADKNYAQLQPIAECADKNRGGIF